MYLILSGSPNTDGLTAACVEAATRGVRQAGHETHALNLCAHRLERCRQCEAGWGICLMEHRCIIEDDLAEIQEMLAECEGLVLVTPVYFGEPSEAAKAAMDRLRRCHFQIGPAAYLQDKPVLSVAAAGGSGGGITSCLASLERWTQHMHGTVWDLVGITRFNREARLQAIQESARRMAERV